MKKQVYRHIGYYSDKEAIELCKYKADYVVATMTNQIGTFHTTKGESESDIEDVNVESDRGQFEKTSNGDYLVRYQNGSTRGKGWFIDIYKLIEIDDETNEPFENTTEECCSVCDSTVVVPAEFKVQVCPECGNYFVPCNICPVDDDSRQCTNCPLSVLADKLNKKARGEMTFNEFVTMFNNSEDCEKVNGFYLSYVDDFLNNRKIYCHYNVLYEMVTLFDADRGGLSYTMKGDKININIFAHAIEEITQRSLTRDLLLKVKPY